MDLGYDTDKLKPLAYKVVIDSGTKTSARVACALVYAALRLGEIIDWWFPVKVVENNKIN